MEEHSALDFARRLGGLERAIEQLAQDIRERDGYAAESRHKTANSLQLIGDRVARLEQIFLTFSVSKRTIIRSILIVAAVISFFAALPAWIWVHLRLN